MDRVWIVYQVSVGGGVTVEDPPVYQVYHNEDAATAAAEKATGIKTPPVNEGEYRYQAQPDLEFVVKAFDIL